MKQPPETTSNLSAHTRRTILASSAAATGLGLLSTGTPQTAAARPAAGAGLIRPFKVAMPESALIDVRRRLSATRWPEKETVGDESQGVPLGMIRAVARRWLTGYDWRKLEAKLNALPQFVTTIDGLDIHFIHVSSKHEDALPLIVTHGWPGSIVEQLKIIDPLTNPTAYGASGSDAFHLVIPSIPGYGFSGKPTTTGWDFARIARAWVELMRRLGYDRFAAQGGDLGAGVAEVMALQQPPQLLGIHVNFPAAIPTDIARSLQVGDPPSAALGDDERQAYEQLQVLFAKRRAYAAMMGTRPQTLYGLADSPVSLAAWMLDHGDGYGQPAPAIKAAVLGGSGDPRFASAVTLDDLLDNINLYWLTNTGVSASRLYWENKFNLYNSADIPVPTAVSVFPGENYQVPRSWAGRAYRNLIYYNRAARGGHFAAWEQPLLFAQEVRTAFKSLRRHQS